MNRARLIVCEPRPRWSIALRGSSVVEAGRLIRCTGWTSCVERWERWPASLIALDVAAAELEEALSAIPRMIARRPAARLAALRPCEFSGEQAGAVLSALREAGAVDVFDSPREAGRLAELARRHFALSGMAQLNFTEQVWADLPWGEFAQRQAN